MLENEYTFAIDLDAFVTRNEVALNSNNIAKNTAYDYDEAENAYIEKLLKEIGE